MVNTTQGTAGIWMQQDLHPPQITDSNQSSIPFLQALPLVTEININPSAEFFYLYPTTLHSIVKEMLPLQLACIRFSPLTLLFNLRCSAMRKTIRHENGCFWKITSHQDWYKWINVLKQNTVSTRKRSSVTWRTWLPETPRRADDYWKYLNCPWLFTYLPGPIIFWWWIVTSSNKQESRTLVGHRLLFQTVDIVTVLKPRSLSLSKSGRTSPHSDLLHSAVALQYVTDRGSLIASQKHAIIWPLLKMLAMVMMTSTTTGLSWIQALGQKWSRKS